MPKAQDYVLKALIGVAVSFFIIGWFLFALGKNDKQPFFTGVSIHLFLRCLAYTGWGWSTITNDAWINDTCVVQRFFNEGRGNGYSRALFEVTNAATKTWRQAAAISFDDSFFLNKWTEVELQEQISFFRQFNSANNSVSCYIPPTTIKYSDSAQRRGYLAYNGVNSAPNFVILNFTEMDLAAKQAVWRALLISGSVLIGVAVLMGVFLFLWWYYFFPRNENRQNGADDGLGKPVPLNREDLNYLKSWNSRKPN